MIFLLSSFFVPGAWFCSVTLNTAPYLSFFALHFEINTGVRENCQTLLGQCDYVLNVLQVVCKRKDDRVSSFIHLASGDCPKWTSFFHGGAK